MSDPDVIIVGGGLSGLTCALRLGEAGIEPLILEASDGVGGRIRTDRIDGFLLDRGFQSLQTAYPEAKAQLDLDALQLHRFSSGALIRTRGKTEAMMDPWRHPSRILENLTNGIGSFSDRWRLAALRRHVLRHSLDELAQEPETTTRNYLVERWGLSLDIVERFLQPWMSGVFLEDQLTTSSRWFTFVFRMFAAGDVALPAEGMEAIPRQLATRLGYQRIRLQTPVVSIEPHQVRLVDGTTLAAEQIVIATPGDVADRLLGREPRMNWCGTVCRYYAADTSPIPAPQLMINGDGRGPIRHVCVPSEVAPTYAPLGRSLIGVSSVGVPKGQDADVEKAVGKQLREWFGSQVDDWHPLARYHIPHAIPARPSYSQHPGDPWISGVLRCGDYLESSSIHGAMHSGRHAAQVLLSSMLTPVG